MAHVFPQRTQRANSPYQCVFLSPPGSIQFMPSMARPGNSFARSQACLCQSLLLCHPLFEGG
ncbi:rCG31430, partial [Rattus norvegicus]